MKRHESYYAEVIADLHKQINELKRENSRLEQLAQQADSANKAKTDFLAMISHEIRTPMNGVVGMCRLLLNTELQDKQLQYVQLINTSANSLMILVNNLLDFSRIESNRMILYQEPFHLDDEIEQLITLHSLAEANSKVHVRSEIDAAISGNQYLGDVHRLRQILVNLLGNALKFTEEGEVVLRVSLEVGSGDRLHFEVQDTGVGIAEKDIPSLFQPFTQVDSSSTRRYGGSGLGLSICARLVQLMGGEIGVQSLAGKGTTFWFNIPLKQLPKPFSQTVDLPAPEPVKMPAAEQLAKRAEHKKPHFAMPAAVLVVDDEPTNRILMQEVLQEVGIKTVAVGSGAEALAAWRQQDFALVFMDCRMPEMDGYSTTRAMLAEAKAEGRKKPVVVALSADGTDAAKMESQEAGMVDYLLKPLDFAHLQQVLATWMPGTAAQSHLHNPPLDSPHNHSPRQMNKAVAKQVLDAQTLGRLRRNLGNIEAVIRVFLESLPKRLAELHEACRNQDAPTVVRIAHTLKGSSVQLGAEELGSLSQQLERLARMGHVDQFGEVLQKIDAAADKVEQAFMKSLQQ
ncbi:MAG: ATP-binding protein [Desulfobulbus sp.]|jgi:CheY-like chemotaxis protein/HPt (histidine-containing phosphotransfer) domain-containing protein